MEPLGDLARDLFAGGPSDPAELRRCAACGRGHDLAGVPADVKFRCLGCGAELAPAAAPARIGKYDVIRRIARGGMGTVFEAVDPELKRRVALKVVREDDADPQTLARFPREAAIAAQLQHPNIVAIHDVGLSRDAAGQVTHFIAMDFVEGVTLADLVRQRGKRDDLLRMLEDVARAAGFAHSKGVIHRDLKPANVLVDGEGRVRLTDFGLARAEGFNTQLTGPQAVMGTPPYMAPEQVRGGTRESDARTDVYALGVMLYEVLTGHVPFMAESAAELYRKISQDEPSRPGREDRTIARDLEVICLKALEKDPARRYADGLDFAEDIARFRRGEAIRARPPSLLYRLRKRIARRKLPAAILLGSVVVVAAILAGLLPALKHWQGRELEGRREQMRLKLAAALDLRRAGRTDLMKKHADDAKRMAGLMIEDMPASAEPHYLAGRIYRALLLDAEAAREQERALAKEPAYAPALYERICLAVRSYRAQLDETEERIRAEEGISRWVMLRVHAQESMELAAARSRVAGDIAACIAALRDDDDRIGRGQRSCAAGLQAWMLGDRAAARDRLSRALTEEPTLEEAYEALATLEMDDRHAEAALRWWSEGLKTDSGYLPFLEGRAETLERRAAEAWNRGDDPQTWFSQAVESYSTAIAKEGTRALLVMKRGRARLDQATALIAEEKRGEALLEASLADFNKALEMDPALVRARTGRGRARLQAAILIAGRGGEAESAFEAAESDFSAALVASPGSHGAFMLRGNVRCTWAEQFMMKQRDPRERFVAALADLDEALRLDPKCDETLAVRGRTRVLRGIWLHARGEDPTGDYEAAIRDLDDCMQIGFGNESPFIWLGRACSNLAQFRSRGGEADLGPLYRKAEQAFAGALKVNAASVDAHRYQGVNYNNWAVFLEKTRPDNVKAKYQKALDHLDEAIRLRPALASDGQIARVLEQCRRKVDREH